MWEVESSCALSGWNGSLLELCCKVAGVVRLEVEGPFIQLQITCLPPFKFTWASFFGPKRHHETVVWGISMNHQNNSG
jgi:hypothetical protein